MSLLNIVDQTGTAPVSVNLNNRKKPASFQGRVALITLGCAKNQVDSEVMLGVLHSAGFEVVSEVAEADVAVVNTCGFLESAVQESLDTILEVAEHKSTGRLRKLIVAGCMVSRYGGDLKKDLPEVDGFLNTDEILKVGTLAGGSASDIFAQSARPYFLYDDTLPRILASKRHSAYVKIAEGCDRPCTFCIIPKIRGRMRSRSIDSILREVQLLSRQGVKEVNLLAQDLTSYGRDQDGVDLAALLRSLDAQGGAEWIRLLYAYPVGIERSLLETIVELKNVCNYLDLPLQHSSESLLKEMKRPIGRYSPRKIVEFIRSAAPKINLRTTFIVGFPGESDQDIEDLERFILEGHFTNLGVFTYSPERGTPAHDLPNQISASLKQERYERLMNAQQKVVAQRLSEFVGKELRVLIEGSHEETDLLLSARTEFQAPEVDGTVMINEIAPDLDDSNRDLTGSIGLARITQVAGYDLLGTLVG